MGKILGTATGPNGFRIILGSGIRCKRNRGVAGGGGDRTGVCGEGEGVACRYLHRPNPMPSCCQL